MRLREIVGNSKWVREIARAGEDKLSLVMVQISNAMAMEFRR
jgi:hypothetical protein